MHVSLDGFVADLKAPPPGLDWMAYTPELEKYAHSFHDRADVAIHGRVTYRLMESYWPTVFEKPSAKPSTLKHARWLQKALKVVVSRTMKSTEYRSALARRMISLGGGSPTGCAARGCPDVLSLPRC